MKYRLVPCDSLPPRRAKASDRAIIEYVRERVLCQVKDIYREFGYALITGATRNRTLWRLLLEGKIKRFRLARGGAQTGAFKRNLADLFGEYYNVDLYYVDEDDVARRLLNDLKVEDRRPSEKHQITNMLHNCLPRSLFLKLYVNYSSRATLRHVGVSGIRVKKEAETR